MKDERLSLSKDMINVDWHTASDGIPDSPFAEEKMNENWAGQNIKRPKKQNAPEPPLSITF